MKKKRKKAKKPKTVSKPPKPKSKKNQPKIMPPEENKAQLPKKQNQIITWLKRVPRKIWVALASLSILVTLSQISGTWKTITDLFKTKAELFREEKFVSGVLLPDDIDLEKPITFIFGTNKLEYTFEELQKIAKVGVKSSLQFSCGKPILDISKAREPDDHIDYSPISSLAFKIIDRRLYVSDTARYVLNEEVTGILDFNEWSLPKDNILDLHQRDNYLEIIDKQGHLCLGVEFIDGNTVQVQGYFINQYYFAVLNSSDNSAPCLIRDDQKQIALNLISQLKSHHKD